MAAKLKLIPGSTIRWGARRFVVVDYVGLDAVIAREVGKRIRFAGGKGLSHTNPSSVRGNGYPWPL